ncbi:MAG: LPS export ABC transporter permease LptF [Alphaproteobacteria bacterium]|nr:LPS export ABC transporter permease LptF [Alphaproteobacteria bacterium]
MRQYERYLFMHLFWPTVVITASLTAIVWLTQILKFLDFMLSRGLSLMDFLYLSGLMLPSLLLILMPIALGIAVIYTYNRLTVESELVVLNAVGVSKWQLAKPALRLGLFCTLLCYVLALALMPHANKKFQDVRTFFRDKYASVLLEEEVFSNPLEGVTVYVRARDEQNNLSGVLMHDRRNPRQIITMIADTGHMEQTPAGPRFYLQQGMRQQWRDGKVSWLAFDDYAIDIAFYGTDVVRKRSPTERTLGELFDREGLTDKQAAANRAEAHQRLTWPLFCLSLPLFALAMLFSSEFNRRGQLKRILTASVGMVAMVLLYFVCRSLSVQQAWVSVMLYVLVLGVAAASASVLYRARVFGAAPPAGLPANVAGA